MLRIKQSPKDWHAVYALYLQSAEWRTKRDAVLKRDGYLCQCCLLRRAATAHHRLYPTPATLANFQTQPAWQLSAICDTCHAMFDGTTFRGAA